MENASRALMIAAGVAIALILLSIGVSLYNQFNTHAQGYIQQWDAIELSKFNSNFETYIGRKDVTAQEIVTIYNKIKEYKDEGLDITFVVPGGTELQNTGDTVSFLQENMQKNFSCSSITYGIYGQVSGISFGITIGSTSGTGSTEIIQQGIEVSFSVNTTDQDANPKTFPSRLVELGDTYGLTGNLPTVVRRGHKFLGWYTLKNDGVLITEDSEVTIANSHTLYAHWEPVKCYVEYNPNAGSRNNDFFRI